MDGQRVRERERERRQKDRVRERERETEMGRERPLRGAFCDRFSGTQGVLSEVPGWPLRDITLREPVAPISVCPLTILAEIITKEFLGTIIFLAVYPPVAQALFKN